MKDVIDIEMLKNKLGVLSQFVPREPKAIVVDFEKARADSERKAEFRVCPNTKCGIPIRCLGRAGS